MAVRPDTATEGRSVEPLQTADQRVASAVRVIAVIEGSTDDAARRSLRAAAVRAGVSEAEIARGVLLFHTRNAAPPAGAQHWLTP